MTYAIIFTRVTLFHCVTDRSFDQDQNLLIYKKPLRFKFISCLFIYSFIHSFNYSRF